MISVKRRTNPPIINVFQTTRHVDFDAILGTKRNISI